MAQVMKKSIVLITLLFVMTNCVYSQNPRVKIMKKIPSSLSAVIDKREDATGEKCALLRIDIVGVKNLKFDQAFGDVKFNMNEYLVYVPTSTREIKYSNGETSGIINLEEYGIELEPMATYQIGLETDDNMRAAVFYIQPKTAKLYFNDEEIGLDENGAVSLERSIGEYKFRVTADGYENYEGSIDLSENEIVVTKDVVLNEIKNTVVLDCNVDTATLYVDNQVYGTITNTSNTILLTNGNHNLKIIANGYEEFSQEVDVQNAPAHVAANLVPLKGKTVKFSNERSKTSISFRNHADIAIGVFTSVDDAFHAFDIKMPIGFVQHFLGILTLREGLGLGIKYYDKESKFLEKNGKTNSEEGVTLYNVEIPLQFGLTFPLNKYNTCMFSVLAGGYGAYMYGSSEKSTTKIEYNIFDYGFRANVNIYVKKFLLSFEGSLSLADKEVGNFVGVSLGYKI